jgi:hypothetical protein
MKRLAFLLLIFIFLAALSPIAISADVTPLRPKLIAAQTEWVGDVYIWNDTDHLYVKYALWEGMCLIDTHVHVSDWAAEVPQVNGNPVPGQFDHETDHYCSTRTFTYTIPLNGAVADDWVVVTAHATVSGLGLDEETAWAVRCGNIAGYSFPGNKWAAFVRYELQ